MNFHPWLFKSVLTMGLLDRPAYAYNLLYAAKQARALGLPRISAIEFGVGTGTGLLALEACAPCISGMLDVNIEVYGFDTGQGLPQLQGLPGHPAPMARGHVCDGLRGAQVAPAIGPSHTGRRPRDAAELLHYLQAAPRRRYPVRRRPLYLDQGGLHGL